LDFLDFQTNWIHLFVLLVYHLPLYYMLLIIFFKNYFF
jgi:hypothetical protein